MGENKVRHKEIEHLQDMINLFEELDYEERRRVLNFLCEKYPIIKIALKKEENEKEM